MLAIPVLYDIAFQTFISCLATQETCLRNGIDLRITPIVGVRYVPAARSRIAHAFLESDATHLFFIDADMEWQANDFLRLLALGTKMECLSAAYPHRGEPPQFMLNLTREFAAGEQIAVNEWGCIPINGTIIKGCGLGFTVIQRRVIEALAESAPRLRLPEEAEPIAMVFDTDAVDGVFRGEDIGFFDRVMAAGFQACIDPSIALGHVGEKVYRGRLSDALKLT